MLSSPCSREQSGTSCGFFLLFAIILLISCCSATTATLGIDWGEEFVKVSVAFRGHRPDILLTSSGSRKFQNVVYLSADTRLFDKEASAYALRDPAKTFQKSAHTLGIPFQGPSWGKFNTLRPGHVEDKFQRNNISFNWDYTPYEFAAAKDGQLHLKLLKDTNVSVEEVYGHFFNHIKSVVLEKLHSMKIIDSLDSNVEILAVIAIPCNYTQNQRKAISFAAESAGLKVVDLVHGITAAALLHSLEMQPGTKRVLFYDMGSSAANVGVVEIFVPKNGAKGKNPQIRTLSCVTVPGVGGRQHDYLLAEYLREAFEKKHSLKLMPSYPKALQKLTRAVNKAKTTLSISTSTSVEIENLVPDKSLDGGKITRDLFDKLLEPIVEKLDGPVPKVLELAGLKKDEIDAVELIGGSWRVPVIQKKIAETVAPHQLGFHLNAEEAVAMGAGYMGAAHNPFFRMKKVDIVDNSAFEYTLYITAKSRDSSKALDKKVVLHNHSSKLSASKTVKLKAYLDLEVVLLENDVAVASYKVTGIDALLKGHADKVAEVSLVFKASLGILKLDQTFAVLVDVASAKDDTVDPVQPEQVESKTVEPSAPIEEPEEPSNAKPKEEDEPTEPPQDTTDSTLTEQVGETHSDDPTEDERKKNEETKEDDGKVDEDTKKDGETSADKPEDDPTPESTLETKEEDDHKPKGDSEEHTAEDEHTKPTEPEKPKEGDKTDQEGKKEPEKPKKESKTVLLFSVTQSGVYSGAKLESCRNSIAELVKRDRAFYERSEAKNKLESLLYKYKSKANSKDFKDATTEQVHAKFSTRVEELLTWFESHSSSASLEQFNEITKELDDVAIPILVRAGHNSDRESVIRSTDRELEKLKSKYDALVAEKPYLLEHHGIVNTFTNILEWWEQAKKEQEERPLNQDPVFTFETVKPKRSTAKLALKTLETIKPKAAEPAPKNDDPTEDERKKNEETKEDTKKDGETSADKPEDDHKPESTLETKEEDDHKPKGDSEEPTAEDEHTKQTEL